MLHYTLGNGIITSESVERAMRAVDRGNYCPFNPYYDSPQSIGYQATISAPHMVSINVDACMHVCTTYGKRKCGCMHACVYLNVYVLIVKAQLIVASSNFF